MDILFIGGTGNVSTATSRQLLSARHRLCLLHRRAMGHEAHKLGLEGAEELLADIQDEPAVARLLQGRHFDVVVDWIAFTPDQVERDLRLFQGRCAQYAFISSASAYEKPPRSAVITERTPLTNPYWQYSRDKIACEEMLRKHMAQGFPATIVRPSLTYDTVLPVPIGGWKETTILERIRKGQPVPVHGDGTAPWTITHSEDFARGFVPLLGHPKAIGEDFNVTGDEHPTWTEIHAMLADACGCRANIVQVSVESILRRAPEYEGTLLGDKAWPALFDNAKLRSLVPDFRTEIPFSEGIKRTVAWFDGDPGRGQVKESTMKLMDELISG